MRHRLLLCLGLAAAAGAAAPASAASALRAAPPAVDSLACQTRAAPATPDRDWAAWDGGDTGLAAGDLLAVAEVYAIGSERLDPNPAVARRLLQHVVDTGNGRIASQARELLAKLILANSTDRTEIKDAVALLEAGVASRDIGAATALGHAYERGRVVARSPAKALAHYRMAAAAGDPQGVLGIARLAKAGAVPEMTEAEVEEAARVALATLMVDVGRGNCQALYAIGLLYDAGDIVPLDQALAAAWYRAAATAIAHPKAAERLAWMYQNGVGVERSLPDMFRYLRIAALGGRPRAMVQVGQAYALGDGTEADGAKAIVWFERADRAHQAAALRWLIRAWRGEFGTPADPVKAFSYLKRSAERPSPDAKTVFELGTAYLAGEGTPVDMEAALAALDRAASLGSEDAAELLGDIHLEGRGMAADPLRAARYYRQAASLGSVAAMTALADMHRCGIGVAFSPQLEQRWRERAAFQGSGASMYRYAAALPVAGTPAEQARRFRLMRRAAMLGSREAMAQVAAAYLVGLGVAADPAAAAAWRERALAPGADAVRGHVALAELYRDGVIVDRDLEAARALLDAIAATGDGRGRYELARFEAAFGGDPARARAILLTAAEAGNAQAMRSVAESLGDGESAGGRDAAGWLAAAAEAGNLRAKLTLLRAGAANEPEATLRDLDALAARGICQPADMADLALAYFAVPGDRGSEAGAAWIARAEATGSAEAETLYSVGRALLDGDGTPAALAQGRTLLERAGEAGLIKAMRRLARDLRTGAFGEPDPTAAAVWMARAAAAGDASAAIDFARQVAADPGASEADRVAARTAMETAARASPRAARELGSMLLAGAFGADAVSEAAGWFARAAEAGDIDAMRQAARLYAAGTAGAERDPVRAIAFLQKAAEAGEARAMFDLAAAYEAGFGAPASPELAAKWFAAARAAGGEAR